MRIELRHLRYFVAVAEEGSFTAAARRVHVAQQVLSAQIRQLEDALGVALLERTSRGVSVTPAGSAFLDSARDTLATLDRGVAAARNTAHAIIGQLTVGLSVAATGQTPTTLLAVFRQAHPQIEVRLQTFELTQPAAGLLDRSTDVAFVRPPIAAPGLSLQQVGAEPRLFVLASDHPLAGRDQLGLDEVAGLPWIATATATDGCDPTCWRDAWLVSPRPRGDQPIIGAVARTLEEWREHVAAGRGISLCPASAEAFHARPGVVFIPSRGLPPTALCVAWRTDDPAPAVRRFIQVVTAQAARTA
jgi:DNA-binding transcriptional LysR family regulator